MNIIDLALLILKLIVVIFAMGMVVTALVSNYGMTVWQLIW